MPRQGGDFCFYDFRSRIKNDHLIYTELAEIQLRSPDGKLCDRIPTLTEFLQFMKDHPAQLALEIKDDNLGTEVIQAIKAYHVSDRSIVTSFQLEHIRKIKECAPKQRVGLLTSEVNDTILNALKKIGAEQICPKASILSPTLVRFLHVEGFSVRAWGVRDEALMQTAYACGVDGMTVNFPEKLRAITEKHRNQAVPSQRKDQ